jgi:hypothetical protein
MEGVVGSSPLSEESLIFNYKTLQLTFLRCNLIELIDVDLAKDLNVDRSSVL